MADSLAIRFGSDISSNDATVIGVKSWAGGSDTYDSGMVPLLSVAPSVVFVSAVSYAMSGVVYKPAINGGLIVNPSTAAQTVNIRFFTDNAWYNATKSFKLNGSSFVQLQEIRYSAKPYVGACDLIYW